MKTVDAFQFNACPAVPSFWHRTVMDIIEYCNTRFRSYYPNLADAALTHARQAGFETIVELGAGCGPLTERMAADERAAGLKFIVCDLIPDRAAFQGLQQRFPERVEAVYEPVDFSLPRTWGSNTLLLLSAALHHVPVAQRPQVLKTLCESAGGVMIFFTVRKTWLCLLMAPLVVVPALLTPVAFWSRPGRWRRVLWCWIIPVSTLMIMWDAVGGCLRQWSRSEWLAVAAESKLPRELVVHETTSGQTVIC